MKNAIIINGTTYELVPNDTGEDVCETCALSDICIGVGVYARSLCIYVHDAELEDHYVKRQKGGES